MTLTSVYALLERILQANKATRLFYISDFDPAGYSMPSAVARKIEFLLRRECSGLDVRLHRLLLNPDHVEHYAQPRTPIKETERRAASFEAHHGSGCVELDALEALHPGELSKIVTQALSHYYSDEAAQGARRKEPSLKRAIGKEVAEITSRYSEHTNAMEAMNQELREIVVPNLERYDPPEPQPTASDADYDWLFDSGRSYFEQIAAYKSYAKGEDPELDAIDCEAIT